MSFMAIGLVPMLLTVVLSLWQTSKGLSEEVYAKLEALRDTKRYGLESFGDTIVSQIITLSQSQDVIRNLKKFKYGYDNYIDETTFLNEKDTDQRIERLRKELANYYFNEFGQAYRDANPDSNLDIQNLLNSLSPVAVALQHSYIYSNSAPLGSKHELLSSGNTTYDSAHKAIHPSISKYLDEFSYYDIFFIDNDGRVIYSVYKELDFATDLNRGPYSNSGLAMAYKQAFKLNNSSDYALTDYAQYTPSYDAPASFISAPVFDKGNKIGVLVFQIPSNKISEVMSIRSGLGETGESYLVGEDYRMRTDSYKNPEDFSVSASFKANHKISNEVVEMALTGQSGVIKTRNYLGEKVLTGYTPVRFGNQQWAMLVDIETSEALSALNKFQWIIAFLTVFVIASILCIAIWVARGIIKPVKAMQSTMEFVAEQGDFSKRVNLVSEDEIGQSARSFNKMLESIEVVFDQINSVVGGFARGDFSQRVEAQANGDLSKLKNNVNQAAGSVDIVVSEVNEVVSAVAQGDFNKRVDSMMEGDLDKLKQGVNDSAQTVSRSMSELGNLLDAMAEGRFSERSKVQLAGEFGNFVTRADDTMAAIQSAFASVGEVMQAISHGQLDTRISAEFPGELATIKQDINNSLQSLSNVLSEVAQVLSSIASGNLANTISADFEGDFDRIKTDTNTTVENLQRVVKDITNTTIEVKSNADGIATGNNNLSRRTEQQAASLEQAATSMDEITTTIQQTAENANEASELASRARREAEQGGKVVSDAVHAMKEINDSSSKISEIIGVIDEIAFQTNLLALNASVEAARAGEQGKGFAVVASEVRNLAGRSATAAKEIKELIEDSVNKVEAGSALVKKSGDTLEGIVSSVQGVSGVVSEIATAADEQSVGVNEVHKSVSDLQSLTQQNTAMVEEAAAASEELSQGVLGLNELVSFFSGTGNEETSIKSDHSSPKQSKTEKLREKLSRTEAAFSSPGTRDNKGFSERRSAQRPWNSNDANQGKAQQSKIESPLSSGQIVNDDFDTDADWEEF